MLIFLAVLCGLIEAIFTALEVALGAVSRARLRTLEIVTPSEETPDVSAQRTARAATRVLKLLERPDRLTLLFISVTSFSLWIAASLLTWQALSTGWPLWVLPLALVALLFGAEVIPLLVAARHAESIALGGAPLLSFARKLFAPLLALTGGIGYAIARLFGSGPNATPAVTQDELRTALATAEEEGVIESEERALLEGAMDFREKVVREVMTPRLDVVGIPADATLDEALAVALREGHSRLPVYEGTIDRIIGVLATKDVLAPLARGESGVKTARETLREAYFVPETKRIAATLEELRHGRTLLAVVVDESGGTAGLVTLEDLLEELVGEIQDEYDVEEAPLRAEMRGEERVLICEAHSTVRDFGRFFASEWKMVSTLQGADGERVDSGRTLASLALELFENVPRVGQRVRAGEAVAASSDIRAGFGLEMEVVGMDGPRIEWLLFRLVGAESGEGN